MLDEAARVDGLLTKKDKVSRSDDSDPRMDALPYRLPPRSPVST